MFYSYEKHVSLKVIQLSHNFTLVSWRKITYSLYGVHPWYQWFSWDVYLYQYSTSVRCTSSEWTVSSPIVFMTTSAMSEVRKHPIDGQKVYGGNSWIYNSFDLDRLLERMKISRQPGANVSEQVFRALIFTSSLSYLGLPYMRVHIGLWRHKLLFLAQSQSVSFSLSFLVFSALIDDVTNLWCQILPFLSLTSSLLLLLSLFLSLEFFQIPKSRQISKFFPSPKVIHNITFWCHHSLRAIGVDAVFPCRQTRRRA